jgi:hypothetical protein
MKAIVIPRTTSSETIRRIGLTMVCGAVFAVTAFFVTLVAKLFPPDWSGPLYLEVYLLL